jgi:Collagen triple helix repeat (20 copies)
MEMRREHERNPRHRHLASLAITAVVSIALALFVDTVFIDRFDSGARGPAGKDAVVTTTLIPAGDPQCQTGGTTVNAGDQKFIICNGLNGIDGAVGPQGPQGRDGTNGRNGANGANGLPGQPGAPVPSPTASPNPSPTPCADEDCDADFPGDGDGDGGQH